jgi:hypothetical protein
MKDKPLGSFLSRPSTVFWGIIIGVILFWIAWIIIIPARFIGTTTRFDNAGQFGDMFGALNTLFTGFAFAGLVYTIILQREEIRRSREEAIDTKMLTERQLFEGTFFQLTKLLNDTIAMIEHRSKGMLWRHFKDPQPEPLPKQGREALNELSDILLNHYISEAIKNNNDLRHAIIEGYGKFYESYETSISHYFRLIYRALQWIDASTVDNKEFYSKIIRAQLSSQELLLLFYDALSEEGIGMERLVVKYHLLKHCPIPRLADASHKLLYHEAAYNDDVPPPL